MLQIRVSLLFYREQEQQSLLRPPFLPGAHQTLSATVAMVLVTSRKTALARNHTLLQLTEVMKVLVILKMN
jgi:hypothetical protein